MLDDDDTTTDQTAEATGEDIARAVDDALFRVLGPRRMAASWVLVADVMDDDGDRFPAVFERPESGWTECIGLLDAGTIIMRGSFIDELRARDDDGD